MRLPADDDRLDVVVRLLGVAHVALVADAAVAADTSSALAAVAAGAVIAVPGVVLALRPGVGRWIARWLFALLDFLA